MLVTYLILLGVGIALAGLVGFIIARVAVAPILRFTAGTDVDEPAASPSSLIAWR